MRHGYAELAALVLAGCAAPQPPPALSVWTASFSVLAALSPADESAPKTPPSPEPVACAPVRPLDVLLIGNSYFIASDTDVVFQAMAADAGVGFHVERLAKGGKDFAYHLGRSQTTATLAQREWDVVVLQSHSLDPLRTPKVFLEAGTGLIEAVRDAGAEPLLFETWPRRAGHNLYNYMDEVGKTPAEMLERVAKTYAELGERTGVRVAKVGTAWARLQKEHPQVQPYLKDGAHPAEAGAYLSAAVLFTMLTERDPRPVLKPHGAVDATEVKAIGSVAMAVVRPPCHW